MTEEELQAAEAIALNSESWRDGLKVATMLANEIRRLRSELASERATHQELWQLVDRELDRIYCDARGIEHGK